MGVLKSRLSSLDAEKASLEDAVEAGRKREEDLQSQLDAKGEDARGLEAELKSARNEVDTLMGLAENARREAEQCRSRAVAETKKALEASGAVNRLEGDLRGLNSQLVVAERHAEALEAVSCGHFPFFQYISQRQNQVSGQVLAPLAVAICPVEGIFARVVCLSSGWTLRVDLLRGARPDTNH